MKVISEREAVPIQQIQGHTICPRKPSLSDYSLHIDPVATRASGKHTTIKNITTLPAILMTMAMRR
jgi:hypothetical protein